MIICCGEALINMVKVQVSGLGEGFLPLTGGSPYNTAVAIGRLDVPVQFLGRFSTDFFGDILVKRLRDNHVKDDLIIRSGQNSTLAFLKLEKDKEPQYVFILKEPQTVPLRWRIFHCQQLKPPKDQNHDRIKIREGMKIGKKLH